MGYPISIQSINESTEFYSEVLPLVASAQDYLSQHHWCDKINHGWLFTNIGYAVCIFLFDIENSEGNDDHLLWVLVGDMPSMYLSAYNTHSTENVIETYVRLVHD